MTLISQLCIALTHLHINDCYHRDLKLDNIMMNKKGN